MSSSSWIALIMLTILYFMSMYDVYLGTAGDETITSVVRNWSSKWPVLPLSIGVIIGHLFWCSCQATVVVKTVIEK